LDELFSLPFAERELPAAILNVAYGAAVVSGPERAEARRFIADLAQLTRILEHPVALRLVLPIKLVGLNAVSSPRRRTPLLRLLIPNAIRVNREIGRARLNCLFHVFGAGALVRRSSALTRRSGRMERANPEIPIR
jgi:hypothetical protein